ncbi:hypothetical protein OHD62_32260 [Mesorhizobium sp. YC-39]|uniref:hypothetical protein n=1 Tax=unclassified Mesorhizobium TaxID=325217 RepID=UPI0021E82D6F|nr:MULTISPECIES: hypothetical protein [unclassified Mesorhizobium]MCV3211254.1 hypothetical protein [Mesorhizobium sp. YC-2]MCV3233058.1 hypothetical protein [Mesorhizobium sp. YC-39]
MVTTHRSGSAAENTGSVLCVNPGAIVVVTAALSADNPSSVGVVFSNVSANRSIYRGQRSEPLAVDLALELGDPYLLPVNQRAFFDASAR